MKQLLVLFILVSTPVLGKFKVEKPSDNYNETVNFQLSNKCQFEIYKSFHKPSKKPLEVIELSSSSIDTKGEFIARDSQNNVIKLFLKNEDNKLNIQIEAGSQHGQRSYTNITVGTLNGLQIRQVGWPTGFLKAGGVSSVNFVCK